VFRLNSDFVLDICLLEKPPSTTDPPFSKQWASKLFALWSPDTIEQLSSKSSVEMEVLGSE